MGLLDKDAYPNWKVAALATANPAYVKGPTQGCGCASAQCMALLSTPSIMLGGGRLIWKAARLGSACACRFTLPPHGNSVQHDSAVDHERTAICDDADGLNINFGAFHQSKLAASLCRSCWRFKCSASNPAGVCKANGGSVVVLITDSCPECKSKNNADFDTQVRHAVHSLCQDTSYRVKHKVPAH